MCGHIISFFLSFICVYVYWAHVCTIMCVCRLLHAIAQEKVTGQPQMLFLTFYHVCVTASLLVWFCLSCLILPLAHLPASKDSSVCLPSPHKSVGFTNTHYHHVWLARVLGIKLWSSHLHDEHFTHFPSPIMIYYTSEILCIAYLQALLLLL